MSGRVWYFAYGSNMQPATFGGRRGIVPLRAVAARLAGWRIVFDKPPILPIGEAMANLVEEARAEVLGVAYEVTTHDLEHIDLTEGVLIDNYRRVTVRLTTLGDPPAALEAFTLTSDRRDPALRPSRRYMSLLVEGAEIHGLPAGYVAWLRSVPAVEETPEGAAARKLLDRALKKEPR
ncbi:MAG TPA: gamma-glutamylcyclotransferase [Candidatus Eisenbacteria bacterium]|nr:gamma-glutamylcyclotransferase [Candidatus Eisenbacteria bacterium]